MSAYSLKIKALADELDALCAVEEPNDEQLARITEIPSLIEAAQKNQQTVESARAQAEAVRAASKPVAASARPHITNPRPRLEDDPAKGFATHKEFFRAVMANDGNNPHDERLKALVPPARMFAADGHSTYNDPHGGFLVPVQFSPEVKTTAAPGDPAAPYVQRIPMGSPRVEINARVDKNHSTSVSGGLRVYRREEGAAAQASRFEVERIALNANNLTGLSYVTEELLQDSPVSVIALLQRGFGEEFEKTIGQERLFGTGVGKFEGIFNSAAKLVIAKENSQANNTVNFANIAKMRGQIYGYESAIWMANHSALPQLIQLKNGDLSTYQVSIREGIPDTLLGRPIFYTEHLPGLGEEGEIILANWSEYLEGTLAPMESGESIHVRFDRYERTFRFNMRNDGRSWWKSQMTPINGPNLSPFVLLGARK